MEQKEYFGFGSIKHLNDILKETSAKNILLVTGKDSYQRCGAKYYLDKIVAKKNKKNFNNFSSSPKFEELHKGYNELVNYDSDLIIGIGGGSVIDSAKFMKLKFFSDLAKEIPLVAVPTTAGSGSEATHFIVYYKNKEKQSAGVSGITLPNYTILDPSLTLSMSPNTLASSGLDALGQAIESYWSINSTTRSKQLSEEAIGLILKNFHSSMTYLDSYSKEAMLKAANLSGKAINITKTTSCHAISYPLTSYYKISHGHAVALTLGEMIIYNSRVSSKDCNDNRGTEYVQQTMKELLNILDVKSPEEAKYKMEDLITNLGLKNHLSNLNIKNSDLPFLIGKSFNKERMGNNPRLLTKKGLERILNNIF